MLDFTKLQPQLQEYAAAVVEAHAAVPLATYARQTGEITPKRLMFRVRHIKDAHDISEMVQLYRAFKALGWTDINQIHPVDKISILALGPARLHRDPDFAAGHWVVELSGAEYAFTGSPAAITAECERLIALVSELPAASVGENAQTMSETRRAELETELESLTRELPHTLPGVSRTACKRQIANIMSELGETVSESDDGNSWGGAPVSVAMSELARKIEASRERIAAAGVKIDTFVSETAGPETPDPDETDGPRNQGESIMALLGQDYKAARKAAKARMAPPTAEQARRGLEAALKPDWAQRHADRRAQFGRGR